MKYGNVIPAVFIDRPNRFIAHVEIGGQTETVHVKNTGRCRELLLPGAEVRICRKAPCWKLKQHCGQPWSWTPPEKTSTGPSWLGVFLCLKWKTGEA